MCIESNQIKDVVIIFIENPKNKFPPNSTDCSEMSAFSYFELIEMRKQHTGSFYNVNIAVEFM